MTPLRVGIVGCGKAAQIHAQAIRNVAGMTLHAVSDVDDARARAFAEVYGGTATQEPGGLDLAIVCTPHPQHKAAAVAALNAGAHVLVEKPLATTVADCDEMIETARARNRILSVVSQRRFFEPIARMKAAIKANKIGTPILGMVAMFSWRDQDYYRSDPWRGRWTTEGGGVLINQSPHHLDLLQWLMEDAGPIEEVTARWANLNHPYIEVEDNALAILRFRSGALASITVSLSQNPGMYTKLHVHGSSGYSVGSQTDTGATFVAGMGEGVEPPFQDLWTIPGEAEVLTTPPVRRDLAYYHELQLRDFVSAVMEGREPAVPGSEGRKVVQLITAIYDSGRTGTTVKLS